MRLSSATASLRLRPTVAHRHVTTRQAPSTVDSFQSSAPCFRDLSGFTTRRYDALIAEQAATHGVPARLIKAVIERASGFDPQAVSSRGGRGLMQLTPATARTLGLHRVEDPRQNIEGGARLLARLLRHFHGNVRNALAAYEVGCATVEAHGGVPPCPRTRDFVQAVAARYGI